MYSAARAQTAGNSMMVADRSGRRSARAMEKQPDPPPTSSSRRTPSRAELRAVVIAAGMEWLCMKAVSIRAMSGASWPLSQASTGRLRALEASGPAATAAATWA